MNWTQFWENLCKRNPDLMDDTTRMTITVANYRRGLKQAFEMGEKNKEDTAKARDKVDQGEGQSR